MNGQTDRGPSERSTLQGGTSDPVRWAYRHPDCAPYASICTKCPGRDRKWARSRPGLQGGGAGRAGWAGVMAESWSPKEAMGSAIRRCVTHFPTVKVANFMLCVFQTQFFFKVSLCTGLLHPWTSVGSAGGDKRVLARPIPACMLPRTCGANEAGGKGAPSSPQYPEHRSEVR